MKSDLVNLIVLAVALAGLGFYACRHIAKNAEKAKRNISVVEVNGKKFAVDEVRVDPIPPKSSFIFPLLSALPAPKEYTYFVVLVFLETIFFTDVF